MMDKTMNVKFLVELAVLVAIIILMAFTPLGYLNIGILAITLIVIPVAVGAVHMGPKAGTILGLVFGLTSFSRAFGMDALGSILLGLNPLGLFVVTVVTRVLVGFLASWIYVGLSKTPLPRNLSTYVGCLMVPVLNTILYMTAFVTIFHDYCAENFGMQAVIPFIVATVGVNGVLEAVTGCIVGGSIVIALRAAFRRR